MYGIETNELKYLYFNLLNEYDSRTDISNHTPYQCPYKYGASGGFTLYVSQFAFPLLVQSPI